MRRFGPETDFRLTFSIGGQIGIDVCPCGWDKTFCLQFLPIEDFDAIHFFGDKTHEGDANLAIPLYSPIVDHTVAINGAERHATHP